MVGDMLRGPVIDGKMIVGFVNAVMFGFQVRGQRVKGLIQKKLDELAQRQAMELSNEAPIAGCADDGDEGLTWGSRLTDDRAQPDVELETLRAEAGQRSTLDSDLQGAIRSLPAVIRATANVAERETLAGILAYAQACTERGEPVVVSSVGIELVTRGDHRELVDGVRLGRCLGHGQADSDLENHAAGDVRLIPKQNWKTSKKLEAFLHQQPDTTIDWASASQATIHKRIIRAIPTLEKQGLVMDLLLHEEDV